MLSILFAASGFAAVYVGNPEFIDLPAGVEVTLDVVP